MHPDRCRLPLELNRAFQLEREPGVIGGGRGPEPHQFAHALPGIERPHMPIGRELKALRHTDVIRRDALPRCHLSGAQERGAAKHDESQGESAMRLHVSCFLERLTAKPS